MAHKAPIVTGTCLAVAGALGFFTYADDIRHAGELAMASGLLLAGFGLLVSAYQPALRLQWFSVAVLVGLLVGSALDATVSGLAGGAAAGAMAAWWLHGRAAKADRPVA